MADYRFSKEKYQQLCYWTKHGKLTETKTLIKEVQPNERARFGPTTFCPPLKYMLESPLVIACYWGKFKIVQYFVETFPNIIDVNTLGVLFLEKKTAITPLIAACKVEHSDDCDQESLNIIQYLISKGAEINKASTDGSTPLHHAHSFETIKYLLECGADINKTCNKGISPLIQVIRNGLLTKEAKIQILRLLLDNNANVYQRSKDRGYTALHHSISHTTGYEVVKLLLDYGAPPMFTATSCVTDIDYIPSPVYLAACTGKEAIIEIFLQREDCPKECKVNVYLLKAIRQHALDLFDEKIGFYRIWIKGLDIMKEHNVQLSYPLPVDEYNLREEVKTKEELDALLGNTLEILIQHALIYERCLGRVCTEYLLKVGDRMIYKGYPKEGEFVIKRAVLLETRVCEEVCSKPPNYYSFPQIYVTNSVLGYFHVFIRELLQRDYPPNFPLYIKFGLTALKTKYHLQLPVEQYNEDGVLTIFYMWICSCHSTNSSYPFELISLAKEFVSNYLYYPEGSELLLSKSNFIYRYPSLLRLLLEVGGDAVINNVGWDGRTLIQLALQEAYKIERVEKFIRLFYEMEEVIRILLEYGAHVDTTNSKGLTLFNDIFRSKLPSYKSLCSPHLPLSLYCTAANAVVKYCIPYQVLPSHVIDFIKLHDPHYFKQFDYFP